MISFIRKFAFLFAMGAAAAFLATPSIAAVTLPPVLSSHMVLQQDIAAPIWGIADPGEKITVTFLGRQKSATADEQGKWMVKLDPLHAGGEPATLTVTGKNTLTLTDVLVGEVWVGSGQSNIDTNVFEYIKIDQPLAEAAGRSYPRLRLLHGNLADGWQETTPQTILRFSAQLFYFGMKLQQELNAPVGLMEGAVAGSRSAPWINQQDFNTDPDIQKNLAAAEARDPYEKRLEQYNNATAKWQLAVDAAKASGTTPLDKLPKAPAKPRHFAEQVTGQNFETHIRPMIPYGIRGVLWDQGESGTGITKIWPGTMMGALVRSWRAEIGDRVTFHGWLSKNPAAWGAP
jgi:sialate O-acetylesterase